MTNKNIIVFSSGISEKKGMVETIKSNLNEKGYTCMDWHDLFANANNMDNIALLPMLIKKIPTFDFAVLICEGHDTTYISRGENSQFVKTMRDNVLFEIGLCAMAIGLNRTILVTDTNIHLPDDLIGVNGQLALKRIVISTDIENDSFKFDDVCKQIDTHIKQEEDKISQVVIGAAASGACGYTANFVCRTLEHIDEGIIIRDAKHEKSIKISPDKIHLHIILPNNLDENVIRDIKKRQETLLRGTVLTARSRPAEFNFYFEGEDIHIVDYPTNVVTSYDTARIILQMDADDRFDKMASIRFVTKEMALFEATMRSTLSYNFIKQVIEEHYLDETEEKKNNMIKNILDIVSNRFTITRYLSAAKVE